MTVKEDHPRLCGDYEALLDAGFLFLGSPPPVRGLRQVLKLNSDGQGITPACAGTTWLLQVLSCIFRDHPRLCGDYKQRECEVFCRLGSPPPVRGLLKIKPKLIKTIRITPACAETTPGSKIFFLHLEDHPRLCGDYLLSLPSLTAIVGSPPPVRGLLSRFDFYSVLARITPACAGTTDADGMPVDIEGDHPRLCGDYHKFSCPSKSLSGSPPPVRGLPSNSTFTLISFRITPACAGTT